MKAHKILDINFDGDELHFDLRVSIPREKITGEYIEDMLKLKPDLHGWMLTCDPTCDYHPKVWMTVGALVETNESGEHTISIQKTMQELR